ncbi:hypothetical protein CN184_25085 [Sinorhizobium medicae]|uniref:hypothetical protein n=1 Tax=Sinorhizobium medicae TaxID=110321 RepID=UPI000FD3F248|nr:hypothetical protein [Sinorhizobium medicae]MQX45941.1 hypothetical protein [Sinorhizobium medicae]RVJ17810.1 hypothetical protein CN184_25085 [Sinorhizobium medicae]
MINEYKGTAPVAVTLDTVINAVKALVEIGKDREFAELCERQGMKVVAQPELVNALKRFLFDNKAHETNDAAMVLVRSPRGSGSCFPLAMTAEESASLVNLVKTAQPPLAR